MLYFLTAYDQSYHISRVVKYKGEKFMTTNFRMTWQKGKIKVISITLIPT